MTPELDRAVLPYSMLVGQKTVKLALELAYINPAVNGVLLSGERGTAKSTAVRAFARMVYGDLPVTLPMNATEDRVAGGLRVADLMEGKATPQPGLLEQADGKILYVDEVNLLDDHLVNLILDVASTGILTVQREGLDEPGKRVSFTLVGSMNPEEGGLRPQLLDRFGLMVDVQREANPLQREKILATVLRFDELRPAGGRTRPSKWLADAAAKDQRHRAALDGARARLPRVKLARDAVERCVRVATAFGVEGHRAELVMAHAARALAARRKAPTATTEDVDQVARLALQHRRPEAARGESVAWDATHDKKLREAGHA